MVVYKRKPTTEHEEAYDNYVEVDERKSYNDSQVEVSDSEIYSPRKDFVDTKPRGEVMPRIKREVKPTPVVKQSVSSKTKVLLAAYIVIAVILAAVVIGTGIAITEVGNRTNKIETQISNVSGAIDDQSGAIANVRNDSFIMGEASKLDMSIIGDDERIGIKSVATVEAATYAPTNDWFDDICDFFSRIFG